MRNTSVPDYLIPSNEVERLQRLLKYEILDTPPERQFDRIAELAAQIFDAPYAQINFIDEHSVFFKSNISPLVFSETHRTDSLCALAILNEGVTVFENLHEIPELSNLPLSKGDNGIKFYAGAPIKTFGGLPLGTVCVLDVKTKAVTEKQLEMLQTLSAIVMDELEMRLTTRMAMRTQTDMMNRVVHDLKNPNTTISLSSELIKKKADDPKIVNDFAERIRGSANNVLGSLNKLLDLSQIENASFRLDLQDVDILELLQQARSNYHLLAKQKRQEIVINCDCLTTLIADPARLQDVFENLLSNAIKYAHPDTQITVNVSRTESELLVEFKDVGQGLTSVDLEKLFIKFAKLSAIPTGREYSNGMGLSIAKMLVELHHGKLWAESEGKDKGSSFFVSIPLH